MKNPVGGNELNQSTIRRKDILGFAPIIKDRTKEAADLNAEFISGPTETRLTAERFLLPSVECAMLQALSNRRRPDERRITTLLETP
jgi:hypothetical protein